MTDYTLKFKTEAKATEVLDMYPGSIDTIGVIFAPSGEVGMDADGQEVPVMTAVPGWHVNVRGPVLPELEAYAIEVATPVRVWA